VERKGVVNFNVAVREWNEQIIFLRKIIPGGADKSYGIQVARLAGAFRARGVAPGDRIAMLGNNSDRYVEFYFASLWAGGVLVPINTRWSANEMAACIDDCEPALLLCDAPHFALARELSQRCRSVRELLLADLRGQADLNELATDAATQLAGHFWTTFPEQLRGHQRFAQLRALELTDQRARTLASDLARETVSEWERFRNRR